MWHEFVYKSRERQKKIQGKLALIKPRLLISTYKKMWYEFVNKSRKR